MPRQPSEASSVASSEAKRCLTYRQRWLLAYATAALLLGGALLLVVFMPKQQEPSFSDDIGYDWSNVGCTMNLKDKNGNVISPVNFTMEFFAFENGLKMMLVDDLQSGVHDTFTANMCQSTDPNCAITGMASETLESDRNGTAVIKDGTAANNDSYSYDYDIIIHKHGVFFDMKFGLFGTATALFEFDSNAGELFMIRRNSTHEGGYYVSQADTMLSGAYNENIDYWDPCDFAYTIPAVTNFMKSVSADWNSEV